MKLAQKNDKISYIVCFSIHSGPLSPKSGASWLPTNGSTLHKQPFFARRVGEMRTKPRQSNARRFVIGLLFCKFGVGGQRSCIEVGKNSYTPKRRHHFGSVCYQIKFFYCYTPPILF